MCSFQQTRLWQNSLGDALKSNSVRRQANRLQESCMKFRERAAMLAAEIARDFPEFTVHDETHLDALWELADLIAGPNLAFTPAEAYVFGGAVLIHDLGMALAAYPDGVKELTRSHLWRDVVAAILRTNLGRTPRAAEIENPDSATVKEAKTRVLRELHAERAGQLALVCWQDGPSSTAYHLNKASPPQAAGYLPVFTFGRSTPQAAGNPPRRD